MTPDTPPHEPLPDECDDLDAVERDEPAPAAASTDKTVSEDKEWEWTGLLGEVYPTDGGTTSMSPPSVEVPPEDPSPPVEAYANTSPSDAEDIDFGATYLTIDTSRPGKGRPQASAALPSSGPGPKGSIGNPLIKPLLPATRRLDIAMALTTTPPPRDFSLPCLRAGTVGGLVSPGGAGKSMLAAQLALMVATGLDTIRGLHGKPGWEHLVVGPVLYASFEDGADDAATRLHHIWKSMGNRATAADLQTATTNLSVETLTGLRPPNLLDGGEWGDWLLDASHGKRLVLIDTLRMAHLGDENDSGAMAQLLAVMQGVALQTGAAILFLHHISKGAALSGQGSSQQAARGSSVITDNARGQFFLSTMTEEESINGASVIHDLDAPTPYKDYPLNSDGPLGRPMRLDYVRFGVAKSNYAAPWPDVWLRRGEHGVLSCARLGPVGGSAPSPANARKGRGGAIQA